MRQPISLSKDLLNKIKKGKGILHLVLIATKPDIIKQAPLILELKKEKEEVLALTQGLYKSFVTPRFFVRKITSIRNFDDLKFLWRAGRRFSAI